MPTHHHYPTAIPVESFCAVIEESTLELQKIQHFLQRAEADPLLLFKESSIYLKSSRNIVTSILGTSYSRNESVTAYAFQVYLATVLDRAFKDWAEKQDWKHDVSVLVRQPSTFPSIFAVYVDEREVIQFNIYERWYGIREKMYSQEELMEQYLKSEENAFSDIEERRNKLAYWIHVKDNPWSFIKNIKDVRILLFERDTIKGNIEKKITSIEQDILSMEQSLAIQKENIPRLLEQQEKRMDVMEKMRAFFVELHYDLMQEKHRLY